MKKSIIALVLLALTAFLITSCNNLQEKGMSNDIPKHEIPGIDEMKEINHKIYIANRKEELLKNHKSISYSFKNQKTDDVAHYYFITADYQYMEGDDWAEISKDRMIYELRGRLKTDDAAMTYKFNLLADQEAELYQYVSATEDGWQDYDHDKFTDCYIQDGKIHLFSEMDEVSSERYASTNVGEEYKGQTYSQEAVVDADTYEFLVDYTFRKKDGKQELVATTTMEYDIPEPAACSIMRVAFEKKSENMMTVTFVADPDTDKEINVSANIPANNECAFITDDQENIAIFTDRECTKPLVEHWNRMSDMTYYIKHK